VRSPTSTWAIGGRIARTGVAKGYLPVLPNKKAFAQVVDDAALSRERAARTARSGADAKLETLLATAIACIDNQAIFRALQSHRQLAPDGSTLLSDTLERNLEELVRFVAGVVERGAKSGELRACDARRAARYLVESMRGAILERLREPQVSSVQADAASVVDFFLHGVGAREKR
jgi:hypothetical protein